MKPKKSKIEAERLRTKTEYHDLNVWQTNTL